MKLFNNSFSLFLCLSIFFSFSVFSMEDEIVFELKREEGKKKAKQIRKKKVTQEKFKRKSFSFSKDFVVFNSKPKSSLKPGTFLKVNIPYPLIASFSEDFPVYGVAVHPFFAVLSGTIKGVKNTNKAILSFDEIIMEGENQAIKSFPVFLSGDLKESLLKDIALNFFESLPSVLALALGSKLPQSQIHFINTDLKNKVGGLSVLETERKKRFQYLEIKNTKLLKVVIK